MWCVWQVGVSQALPAPAGSATLGPVSLETVATGGNGNVGLLEEFVDVPPCVIASARAVRWVP